MNAPPSSDPYHVFKAELVGSTVGKDEVEQRLSFLENRTKWHHNVLWILCVVFAVVLFFFGPLVLAVVYDHFQRFPGHQ